MKSISNSNRNNLSGQILNTLPHIFHIIRKTVQSLKSDLAPNQIKILHIIHHHSTTVNELSKKFDVAPPTMSEAVDSLVLKKLVKKNKSKIDGRVVNLTLTNLGIKEMIKTNKKITSVLDKKLNVLNAQEKKIVSEAISILQKLFQPTNNK